MIASVGGILASLASTTVKPTVFVTSFSFAIYVAARVCVVGRRGARAGETWAGIPIRAGFDVGGVRHLLAGVRVYRVPA